MATTKQEQPSPIPIFDRVEELMTKQVPDFVPAQFAEEYQQAVDFLLSYKGNAETFKTYRREIERFMQWAWFFASLPIKSLQRPDIENYLLFCRKPPNHWIGTSTVAKFIDADGKRKPNPEWRPYVAKIAKSQRKQGDMPKRSQYTLSGKGFREIFTILHGFYKHLVQAGHVKTNIIDLIKQKTQFYRVQQTKQKIRRISELHWDVVMETAEDMAAKEPTKHERTLFIISILYGLYLRVSELASSERWTPTMNDFEKDHEGNWWFTTVGKGNKERRIAVSNMMLKALERWRQYLGLPTALPLANDNSPLIPARSPHTPISSTRQIRNIVQECFDRSVEKLRKDGFTHEADELQEATVHWLRHTGISDDVKIRPREHVRDDAGHSSSLITDRYIDVDTRERHKSAEDKLLKH